MAVLTSSRYRHLLFSWVLCVGQLLEIIGRFKPSASTTLLGNIKRKKVISIKQISKAQIEKLLKDRVIRNTRRGYVKRNGEHVGYYKTCGGKRYIEDYYVDLFNK